MGVFTGTYSASTQQTDFEASRLGDGIIGTGSRWASSATGNTHWVRLDAGSAQVATSYTIGSGLFTIGQEPIAWTFEGSNDIVTPTWTTLDTRSITASTATKHYAISNTTAYRYYRLNITAIQNAADICSLSEFQVSGGTTFKSFENVSGTIATYSNGTPASVTVHSDGTTYNMGQIVKTSVDCEITHLRYYEPSGLAGTVTLRLYGASNAVVASTTHTAVSSASGWRDVALSSPYAITAGVEYQAAMRLPGGWFARSGYSTQNLDLWWGPLVHPAVGNCTYGSLTTQGRLGFDDSAPSGYFGDSTYAVGVVIELPASGPAGSGTGSFAWAGSGSGSSERSGSGTGTFAWAGTGSGSAEKSGSGAGAFAWTGTGSGATPPIVSNGSGTGAFSWAGTAAGSTVKSGTGTGAFAWAGTGSGSSGIEPSGSGAGTFGWVGTGSGTGSVTLDPWVSGAHGEALLNLDTPTGVLEITYPAEPAPANIVEVSLQRASHQMPALTGVRAMDYDIVTDVVGTPHVWVDGVDVTYFRDVPCIIGAPREESPFGWTSATLTFPQVFHYEERGVGDLAWMRADAPVEIAIVTPLGGRIHKFTGQLASDDPGVGRGRTECTWQCEGILWQAEHAHHPVPARLAPTDVGTLIPDELNGTPSRRFAPFARVVTGILSRKRGSTRTKRWGHAADLLSTAIEDNGDMWTIESTGPKSFRMALKDTTTVHWTISAGAPGVALDLSKDHHERIDAVYASGVGPDGYAWRNDFFPDLLPYDPPDYPYADPDDMVGIGSTDASTLTGTGISEWQRRIRDLGYTSLAVDGVINSADIAAVRWIQRKRGIQLDGVMGPQTWAASWNVGAVGGDLRTVRLPMAWRSEVEPWLYGANGATVGLNPDYDPSIIRHEIDVHLGENITKEQGREVCQRILERGMDPGIAGTITMTTCPWEGSRHEISAGDNVLLKGFQGDDVLMRVVALDPDWQAGDTPVRLTVDSEFRDAMAVLEILERNRESKADPARRPGNPNRRSRLDQDMVTPFEGESPAGRLPRMAIFEGLWTVWPVPVSEVGIIAKLRFQTTGPASQFAVALFGRPVTANQVAAKVPHPLSSSNPWADAGDSWLDAVGFIDAWGEEGQAAGYGMLGTEADGSPVTGELYDDAGVPYISQVSPWVWVGLYSPASCYIEGRIYPDVVQ